MNVLVTGATGQDAYYLTELLVNKGYRVFGLVRGQDPKPIPPRMTPIAGDLTDLSSLIRAVQEARPDEVYNLGAISHVGHSFNQPELTANVTGLGALRMLEAVKAAAPRARYYQASSSEQFGKVRETPQTELTPFHPRSPYGCAKTYAHAITVNYREAYDIQASCGILFNHESPRRGTEFVTRKITLGMARIAAGQQDTLRLGNLDARRDWGHAKDYVDAMWRMMQVEPDDYVIATGRTHTVREVVALAQAYFGLDDVVETDSNQIRPSEVDLLCGDATKALQLGWYARTTFDDLIGEMCEADEWSVKNA